MAIALLIHPSLTALHRGDCCRDLQSGCGSYCCGVGAAVDSERCIQRHFRVYPRCPISPASTVLAMVGDRLSCHRPSLGASQTLRFILTILRLMTAKSSRLRIYVSELASGGTS